MVIESDTLPHSNKVEVMGLREAFRYGIEATAQQRSERRALREQCPTSDCDLVIPSAQNDPLQISPGLLGAANVIQLKLLEHDGLGLTDDQKELIEQHDAARSNRERFLKCGWSRLFPHLKHKAESTIVL